MSAAQFAEVNLSSAQIGRNLDMSGAKVTGTLRMDSTSIGDSLLMRGGAEFAEVNLRAAQIGGQLSLIRAKVAGTLEAESASIGSHLLMRDGQFSRQDRAGARLDGELLLAADSQLPIWGDGTRLVLRNARVAALQDRPGAWPDRLDLDGFTYESFGGLGGGAVASIESRGSRWFVDWLARDEPYTPQPYQHCAKVLREMGHPDMGDDVLYAGRERERAESWQINKLRWFGLSLLNWTIGYGYGRGYFRALWWVLGFVVLGTAVLLSFGDPKRVAGPIDRAAAGDWEAFRHVPALAFYSLDVLLPVTQLHEPHYKIALDGVPKYYFAFHKLMGYVLASFLIAGLSGLTK
jgi:hypothetical protein